MGRIVGLIPPEPEEVKAEKIMQTGEVPADPVAEETAAVEAGEIGADDDAAPSQPAKRSSKK